MNNKNDCLIALFIISNLTSVPCSAANISEQQLADQLKELYTSKKYSEDQIRPYGLSGEKKRIVQKYMDWLVRQPEFTLRAAKLLLQVGGNDLKNFQSYDEGYVAGQKIGIALLTDLSAKGLTKLNTRDLRTYYNYQLRALDIYTPQYCKKLTFGPRDSTFANETIQMNRRFYAHLSIPEVREFVAISQRSMKAALDDSISQKIIQPAERDIATMAWQNAMIKECKKLPANECNKFIQAASEPDKATDAELCNVAKLTMRAMYNLDDLLFSIVAIDSLK